MLFSKLAFLTIVAVASAAPGVSQFTPGSKLSLITDDLFLLNTMNITEMLEGWEEVGLVLSGVIFHGENSSDLTDIESFTIAPGTLEDRAPTASCGSPSCQSSSSRYKLFSPAQEKFIAGKFCPAVATYGPALTGATISFLFADAICGNNRPCGLVATWVGAIAGAVPDTIDALTSACTESLTAIMNGCGDLGGSDTCTLSGSSSKYSVYATTAGSGCPTTRGTCGTVECDTDNNNCQKY